MEAKHLKIVDYRSFHPVTEKLGLLSHSIEYKLRNPDSSRKLITEQEIYDQLREIIELYHKI